MAVERIRDTYQKYLPPFMDVEKQTMTFSHIIYYFPTKQLLRSMHERLSEAVANKDYATILKRIDAMEPYRIGMKVSDARKQTVATDV